MIQEIAQQLDKEIKSIKGEKEKRLHKVFMYRNFENINYKINIINFGKRINSHHRNINYGLLKNLEKLDLDMFGIGDKNILWGLLLHKTLTTKKNGRPAQITLQGYGKLKNMYGKIGREKFKKIINQHLTIGKGDKLKKNEERLQQSLKGLLSIQTFYCYINNKLVLTDKKKELEELLFMMGYENKTVKPLESKFRYEILDKIKQRLDDFFGEKNKRGNFVRGTFLNPSSNAKDTSNMIELPNDEFESFLKKHGIKFDDSYINPVMIDYIITEKIIEGFFLNYGCLEEDMIL